MEKIEHQKSLPLNEDTSLTFTPADYGLFIMRLAVGGLMLFHGLHKLILGNQFVNDVLVNVGIPSFFSFGVFIGEVLAPVLLILGYKVRIAGVLVALNMLIAILLVHSSELNQVSETGGWMIELNALYLLGAVSISLLGSGQLAISKGKGALD